MLGAEDLAAAVIPLTAAEVASWDGRDFVPEGRIEIEPVRYPELDDEFEGRDLPDSNAQFKPHRPTRHSSTGIAPVREHSLGGGRGNHRERPRNCRSHWGSILIVTCAREFDRTEGHG